VAVAVVITAIVVIGVEVVTIYACVFVVF
jgi:hypothetical protein